MGEALQSWWEMKRFLFFIILIAGAVMMMRDWFLTGKVDQFIAERKSSPFAPTAIYWIGETYYLFQEPAFAQRYFEWLIHDYTEHPKLDKVRWELAQCYEELGQKQKAQEQYTILKSSYPSTHYGRLGSARYEKMRF